MRTRQPLGTLAAYLLEPQAEDGLGAWGFFEAALHQGSDYPVLRLQDTTPVEAGPPRPLADERPKDQILTFEKAYRGDRRPDFSGSPVSGIEWLDDGEHFLQTKEGERRRVHAARGP